MDFTAIQARTHFLAGSNSTNYPIASLTASANVAVEHIVGLILKHDARWQFDDGNQSDLASGTTQINANQQDYTLSTSHLSIDRVEVKDSGGNGHLLTQIDQQLYKGPNGRSLIAYSTERGVPTEYDISGISIFLYPVPNYTLAAALKFWFTRPPVEFTVSDTTREPGFNSLFHDLVPMWAAYDYCLKTGKNNLATGLFNAIQRKEEDLIDFYGQRNRDTRGRFTVNENNQ